jgi:hypothetical protein
MSWVMYAWIAILSMCLGTAAGQEDLCACSPSKYTFKLDFSLTCPPVDVSRNGGISATFCQISPFGDADLNITDLVPVEVQYIDVLELGQGFEVLSQDNITGTFVDGDTFEYESLVTVGEENIPKVIQLNIFAYNDAGEPIINFYAIAYSNACDEYPTLIEGESAGWTQFAKLEAPSPDVCPAVGTLTPDTDAPTTAPVTPATDAPTAAPTTPATDAPTAAPVTPDTDAPTVAPITPATDAPTTAPITPATDAPTVTPGTPSPTKAPVDITKPPTDMSMAMNIVLDDFEKGANEWADIQYGITDLSMSMSMPSYGGAYLRKQTKEAKSEKSVKAKSEKSVKVKSEKSAKVKSEKSAKVKSEKSVKAKSVKAAKNPVPKSTKDETVRRRRRLRVHRVD